MRLPLIELDHALGAGQRRTAQQNGVDQAEDGRIGPNAEREGEDGDNGEADAFAHAAQGNPEIGEQAFHVFAPEG